MSVQAFAWLGNKLGVKFTEKPDEHGLDGSPDSPLFTGVSSQSQPYDPVRDIQANSGESGALANAKGLLSGVSSGIGSYWAKASQKVSEVLQSPGGNNDNDPFGTSSAARSQRGGFGSYNASAGGNADVDENGLPISKNWYYFDKTLNRWCVTAEAPESERREFEEKLQEAERERMGIKKEVAPPPPPSMGGPPLAGGPPPPGSAAPHGRGATPQYAVPDYFGSGSTPSARAAPVSYQVTGPPQGTQAGPGMGTPYGSTAANADPYSTTNTSSYPYLSSAPLARPGGGAGGGPAAGAPYTPQAMPQPSAPTTAAWGNTGMPAARASTFGQPSPAPFQSAPVAQQWGQTATTPAYPPAPTPTAQAPSATGSNAFAKPSSLRTSQLATPSPTAEPGAAPSMASSSYPYSKPPSVTPVSTAAPPAPQQQAPWPSQPSQPPHAFSTTFVPSPSAPTTAPSSWKPPSVPGTSRTPSAVADLTPKAVPSPTPPQTATSPFTPSQTSVGPPSAQPTQPAGAAGRNPFAAASPSWHDAGAFASAHGDAQTATVSTAPAATNAPAASSAHAALQPPRLAQTASLAAPATTTMSAATTTATASPAAPPPPPSAPTAPSRPPPPSAGAAHRPEAGAGIRTRYSMPTDFTGAMGGSASPAQPQPPAETTSTATSGFAAAPPAPPRPQPPVAQPTQSSPWAAQPTASPPAVPAQSPSPFVGSVNPFASSASPSRAPSQPTSTFADPAPAPSAAQAPSNPYALRPVTSSVQAPAPGTSQPTPKLTPGVPPPPSFKPFVPH